MDVIKCIYDNNNILYYEPYINVQLNKEIIDGFNFCIKSFDENNIVYIASKIWEKLEEENKKLEEENKKIN